MNPTKDFTKGTIKSLAARGIVIISSTWCAGEDGTFANGRVGYVLDVKGQHQIRFYSEVCDMAIKAQRI